MPKPSTLEQEEDQQDPGSSQLDAVSRLIKPNAQAATWICPDCGQPVQPILLDKRGYLPRAWCDCPRSLQRRDQAVAIRAALDEQERVQTDRFHLLKACELTAEQCAGMGFETWKQDTQARRTAFSLARKAVRRLLAGEWGYWTGPFGCGKTHLAYAICRAIVLEHGRSARVLNWTRVVGELQASWNSDQQQRGDEINLLRIASSTRVLFLDDVDKLFPSVNSDRVVSHWYASLLYRIIDARYSRRLATVFIANMTLAEFKRVLSRSSENAAAAVISRLERSPSVSVDWGRIGLRQWVSKPVDEWPLF